MRIAIVSLACRFPDANDAAALWDNVLAGRRAFRAIPSERLDLAQYAVDLVGEADSITRVKAGLLTDWQFDCARFRIPQAVFEATDLTHWLALDVASEAVARAGGVGVLDRDRTAVIVANTLTGEFSRAGLLRLRAPFLDDLLIDAMNGAGLDPAAAGDVRRRFLEGLRGRFPAPQEDMLAGGLANTIAGRVANYFDLHAGAYTVDAACASSLVGLANAGDLLCSGAADAVVVGAVDLSLDPFELVGFSRNGALATDDMRVFDARCAGFWPGEGAGFAVLMLESEARRRDLPMVATMRGWGMSTDGAGGFTRPAVSGQILALQRAYKRAAVDMADIGYVEAHGTGTALGDPVEVRALAASRNGAAEPLPIGSIKANIGHTKAAAGFAGLIKTISALQTGILPPHVGCAVPHPVFAEVDHRVRPVLVPEAWPRAGARLAGVSGFGFGGINAHIVLEGRSATVPVVLPAPPRRQDAELFVFAGSPQQVVSQMGLLARRAGGLSLAELTDAAATCAQQLAAGPLHGAIVAGDPEPLVAKLDRAIQAIQAGAEIVDADEGVFVARRTAARIGFLFPGQAAPSRPQGGAWARRFDATRELIAQVSGPSADPVDTRIAQPAIAAASLAALRILRACGIDAEAACGHSLGELTALAWAGALREEDLVPLASVRGTIMAAEGGSGGAMLRVAAPASEVLHLMAGLVVACHNGPRDIVVSGPQSDVLRAEQSARQCGIETTRLTVSHAFHSAMMAPAVPSFTAAARAVPISRPRRPVWSTVTGARLSDTDDVAALLSRQIVAPVQFEQALRGMAADADILIEVGPGAGLTRLARAAGWTAASLDAFGDSLKPLLSAIGLAFAVGRQPIDLRPLFDGRAARPIDLAAMPRFLANPCGRRAGQARIEPITVPASAPEPATAPEPVVAATDVLGAVRSVLADETGFAAEAIQDDDRFLDDLHLNSIAVARIVAKVARLVGCRMPDAPTEFANANARELAAGLVAQRDLAPQQEPDWERVPSVRPWVRPFEVLWTERRMAPRGSRSVAWKLVVIQGSTDDAAAATLAANAAAEEPPSGPDGLLIWLGDGADVQSSYDLFGACRAVWADQKVQHLAICHAGAPIAAFARSLALEGRFESVLVVERAAGDPAASRVSAELGRKVDAFYEVRLEPDGGCREPHFALAQPSLVTESVFTAGDTILVTGGAKGIGAECALRLANRSGAALIFCGRSAADDAAVTATLERARLLGARCRYVMADVTDAPRLIAATRAAARELGAITALLHVAGVNEPHLFQDIDDVELHRLLAPKTIGLLAAVEAAGSKLRHIMTFGSILGRMGLKGETHYALANAWQSALAESIARARPQCRVLSLEWSIWNGAGMGHRLGSLERLARYGVDAIALDAGIDAFERFALGGATGSLIVASRFGPPSHVALAAAELPMLRFLDRVLLHYPRLELVVESELSLGRDPYLDDHRLDGLAVLPAVLGLEAMAQAAGALVGEDRPTGIEEVFFRQAIVVPDRGAVRVKIVALAGEDGRVDVAIRGEDDAFATDRMRATFRFGLPLSVRPVQATGHAAIHAAIHAAVHADRLYGPLFFHGESFRRLHAYSRLSARRLAASLLPAAPQDWFGAFEPQHLVLGDPGIRDALLHALQAAVPHLRVVPVSVDRISLCGDGPPVRLEAAETSATADTFVFDIYAFDADGTVVECWHGASFQAIGDIVVDPVIAAVPEIVGPYLERVARAATLEGSIEVALVAGHFDDPTVRRTRALAALELGGPVLARADGKPLPAGKAAGLHLSIAHCDGLTLAVKAECEVGCDVEPMDMRARTDGASPLSLPALALTEDLVATGTEQWPTAATRVWTLQEVAIKQDRRLDLPCKMLRSRVNDIVTFESAFGCTTTIVVSSLAGGLVFAIGTTPRPPRRTSPMALEAACLPAGGV